VWLCCLPLNALAANLAITWLQANVSSVMLVARPVQGQETLPALVHVFPLVYQLQGVAIFVSNRQNVHQSAPHVMVHYLGIA